MIDKYRILCDGCSYTRSPGHHNNWVTYLPGSLGKNLYNIAKQGSGIQSSRVERFLKGKTEFPSLSGWNKTIKLTHFIYQIPTPTRQPLDLNDFNDNHFRVTFKDHINPNLPPDEFELLKNTTSTIWKYLKHTKLWRKVKREGIHKHLQEIRDLNIFKNKNLYYKKVIDKLKYNVTLIRELYPDIKILFLRYEKSNAPIFTEFHSDFFKKDIKTFCDKNNILYICEENFYTSWFKERKMTKDETHPNEEGAKFIGETVKSYL